MQGWLDHVGHDHSIRRRRRKDFEDRLTWTKHRPLRLERTRANREVTTDLARVDIADWLSTPSPTSAPEDGEPYPSPAEQVTALAEEMTRGAWREIATELDCATPDATRVRKDLTHHGWCDLFIALVQVIEVTRRGFDSIPLRVKEMILRSPLQAERPHVTEAVVALIVDKAWQGFQAAAFAGAPLLDLISHEEALRALRILALFICPAPAQHPAVRQHALKPLGEDATKILTDQTKTRLADLFTDWRSDRAAPPGE
ncbi:hypothetical protein O7602_16920 [Micromonospora sp. WMMD1128]|uniref:hypothetical protein n=1 Tax=Micromonospora sp. WMMD1128 TaxID=3015150 RepID=UPI00248D0444|nr:hypothetical protein [Micromonospora sp. WMMD1128]WBB71443.1 hypothetical protein O7602_16920 [Micromonospora sp. WMMD1128]